nr:RteC domain-containing protein [Allomuricauda sp.]
MNQNPLIKNLPQLLNDIKSENNKIIDRAYKSILVCRDVLSELKKEVINDGFSSIDEEIRFFKETKQIPLEHLIYFSEVHSFEIQFPKIDFKSQLKSIKKKSDKVNRFFLYNLDFGRYIELGQTHFDKEYYTREHLNGTPITLSRFYFQDPEFCTARDMLLGKYNAYKSLAKYLTAKKRKLKNEMNRITPSVGNFEKMHWPFSNTDYVELLYALHSKGLGKKDNLSIAKVSEKLQQVFDFTPKDIYKTFQEAKNRKKSRTPFLDELTSSLLDEMNNSEG